MQVQLKEYAGAEYDSLRVCRCSICFFESMQVQLKDYAGAEYDILRVCRCSREYAGAPDGGAAVGDKFGAAREAARPPPPACSPLLLFSTSRLFIFSTMSENNSK